MRETIQNLRKNGFEVVVAESAAWALVHAKGMIKKGMSVGLGDSATVTQIGLLDYLESLKDITLYNQYEDDITQSEDYHIRRMGLVSDLYITGCNAITRSGKLVNADNIGNRIAAQLYGPRKVVIFAGTNKIVDSVDDGFKRIREIVAPKNVDRCNERALSYGKKAKYTSVNMTKKWSIIDGDEAGRTTIVLINQELGF